jgi:hypothetical protein
MPTNSVLKRAVRSDQKALAEYALSVYLQDHGTSSLMPCTPCFRAGRDYVIALGLKRCGECISRKKSYDGNNFAFTLISSIDELRATYEERRKL